MRCRRAKNREAAAPPGARVLIGDSILGPIVDTYADFSEAWLSINDAGEVVFRAELMNAFEEIFVVDSAEVSFGNGRYRIGDAAPAPRAACPDGF